MFEVRKHGRSNKNNTSQAVTGLSANKIKWIRSLQQKKFRDELGLFVVEGEKLVQEALQIHPELIEFIVITDRCRQDFQNLENSALASEAEFRKISSLQHPQGCLAVLKKFDSSNKSKTKGLTLALDGIQDPGNMGTILRIADWFGIQQIVCSKNTVDCYNPKVVQASMGAVLRVQLTYADLKNWLSEIQTPVYGALLEGNSIYQEKLPNEAVILVGNEGNGITEELKPIINHPITIPSFGGSESLNVAVATGIIVSEFKRS